MQQEEIVLRISVAAGVLGLVVLDGCAATDASRSLGTAAQRHVVEWKDVPSGRGQTRRVPFWFRQRRLSGPLPQPQMSVSRPLNSGLSNGETCHRGAGKHDESFWVRGTE